MGVALWRRARCDEDATEVPAYVPPPAAGYEYRLEVFGQPRSPWRASPAEAMADAIAADLAAWDESQQQHFLAVPVDMKMQRIGKLPGA